MDAGHTVKLFHFTSYSPMYLVSLTAPSWNIKSVHWSTYPPGAVSTVEVSPITLVNNVISRNSHHSWISQITLDYTASVLVLFLPLGHFNPQLYSLKAKWKVTYPFLNLSLLHCYPFLFYHRQTGVEERTLPSYKFFPSSSFLLHLLFSRTWTSRPGSGMLIRWLFPADWALRSGTK